MADDNDRLHPPLGTIIERCSASREKRRQTYRLLRHWYLRGCELNNLPALFNRLHAHVELLSSMIYAPESARFWLGVSPSERAEYMDRLDVARDEFSQHWRNCGADVDFASYVDWAAVYGTLIVKIIPGPNGAVREAPIDPAAFGVGREDIPSLDRQPYFVHWYVISLPELKDKIAALPVAEQADILSLAESQSLPNNSAGVDQNMPGGMMGSVIVTSVNDTDRVQGFLDLSSLNQDRPEVTEPLVELAEVWQRCQYQRNDAKTPTGAFWDWKVSTCLGTYVLWETRNPVLPYVPGDRAGKGAIEAEQPFVAIRLGVLIDYFWGRSELAPLTRLQVAADDHLTDIREMMGRQLDPSGLMTGINLPQDKISAIRNKGNWISTQQAGGKLQPLVPTMPPQAFDLLTKFDQMFNEEGGIPEDLGTAQEDIRVQGQIQGTARKMGRIRKKALVVEDALEVLATRMFHVKQRNDATEYTVGEGDTAETFVLADLPMNAVVKVSAHSASPVYAEQALEKALVLYKAGAIDDASLIEILDPPMMELLREKAKAIMAAKAEAAGKKQEIEYLKATRAARR